MMTPARIEQLHLLAPQMIVDRSRKPRLPDSLSRDKTGLFPSGVTTTGLVSFGGQFPAGATIDRSRWGLLAGLTLLISEVS